MARMTRELHRSARGPVLSDEDQWTLVFNTATGRFHVEHAWEYADVSGGGRADHGMRRMDLAEALAGGVPPQAGDKLLELLRGIFEARTGT
jgi:hypothetical protein